MAVYKQNFGGRARIIKTPIEVRNNKTVVYKQCTALWDTGATDTAISTELFYSLALSKLDARKIDGVGGISFNAIIAAVNIRLPNGALFKNHRVYVCPLAGGVDVLIGMDIITACDFALCGYGGVTLFAFDSPPSKVPFDNLRGA